MKRTPLYDEHEKLGAKFTEFSGWEMPVQYTSIIDEHTAVRTNVGMFDTSHMGSL
jgi:aminomethyltransferase